LVVGDWWLLIGDWWLVSSGLGNGDSGLEGGWGDGIAGGDFFLETAERSAGRRIRGVFVFADAIF
jgi:hypothetical protein